MKDDIETRPKDSNADAWHLFLSEYLDNRATSPGGLTFMAVQIAEAIDDAENRGKLPCGHHASCLVKSVESDSQYCGFCDIMSQRNDAVEMEERYRAERDSLRKALDDRFAADQRAAKAIFAETGRTACFPSVKEVVAYYIAENERLETRVAELEKRLFPEDCPPADQERDYLAGQCATLGKENDSLRAMLERAKGALAKSITAIDDWLFTYASDECETVRVEEAKARLREHGTLYYISTVQQANRAVFAELSADAPAELDAASSRK